MWIPLCKAWYPSSKITKLILHPDNETSCLGWRSSISDERDSFTWILSSLVMEKLASHLNAKLFFSSDRWTSSCMRFWLSFTRPSYLDLLNKLHIYACWSFISSTVFYILTGEINKRTHGLRRSIGERIRKVRSLGVYPDTENNPTLKTHIYNMYSWNKIYPCIYKRSVEAWGISCDNVVPKLGRNAWKKR